MQAEMPFYEGVEDAIKDAVRALGGNKVVGPMLWPDKSIDGAARYLNDCLNPSRAEKLEITQLMFILQKSKDAGNHSAFEWIAGDIGYEARPITKAEEMDRLTQVVEHSTKALQDALKMLDKIQSRRSTE